MINRFFRSLGMALVALVFQPIAFAVAAPLELLRYVTIHSAGSEYSEARLRAELSLMAGADDERTAQRSDLRREGHGFRMASAEQLESFAPA